MSTPPELLQGDGGAVGRAVFPPGHVFRAHHHRQVTEVFVCTSGRLTVTIGDAMHELAPGEVAVAPPGAVHQAANTSTEPAEFFYVKTPPRLDDVVWADEIEEKP